MKSLLNTCFVVFLVVNVYAQSREIDSLKLLLETTDKVEQISLYKQIAHLYHDQQQDSLYMKYMRDANSLSKTYELKQEICSTSYFLGEGKFRLYAYDSARYYYKHALMLAEELQDADLKALLQSSVGLTYLKQQQYDEAKPFFEQALEYERQAGDSVRIMKILGYLGVYYSNKGDYKKSADYTFEAIEIAEKLGMRRRQSILLTNLGVLHGRMKDYENALKYQRLSLIIDHEINDTEGLSYGYHNMGNIHRRKGSRDSAMFYYQKAKSYYKIRGNFYALAGVLTNIGVYYLEEAQYGEAHTYFARALTIADSMSLAYNKGQAYVNIANTYEEEGYLNKAEQYYHKALSIAEDQKDLRGSTDFTKHLAKLYGKMKKHQQAYEYLEKYIVLHDSIMTEANQKAIMELRTKYDTEKVEQENQILTQETEIKSLEIKRQNLRFWIFISGTGFILLLLLFAFLIYRLRQQKAKAQLEKQKLENEQRMLRSQMNPHFIFNSMNSIQGYISGNDSLTAMTYLSKFAKLMRGILENSRNPMISLDDEINTLELYTELEELRFRNKFKTVFQIDPQIDTERTYVPPMLIQPFVENAIKHGLTSKTGDGKLEITLSTADNFIKCIVTDNGIGRKASMKINRPTDGNHRSLGIQVTRERMEAIAKNKGVDCTFVVTDLIDDNGNAAGTRVEISLPFEKE